MLEEGFDVGIIAGHIIDETVVGMSLHPIKRSVYAAPNFLDAQYSSKAVEKPNDWLAPEDVEKKTISTFIR